VPTLQSNEDDAGPWWYADGLACLALSSGATEGTIEAAQGFDSRHEELSAGARSGLDHLHLRPQSMRANNRYDTAVDSMRHNRLVPEERGELLPQRHVLDEEEFPQYWLRPGAHFVRKSQALTKGQKRKERRQEEWRLDKSCWASRGSGDGRGPGGSGGGGRSTYVGGSCNGERHGRSRRVRGSCNDETQTGMGSYKADGTGGAHYEEDETDGAEGVRNEGGGGGDFIESESALDSLFSADWAIASGSHGLAWFIIKCSHDPSTWQTLDRAGQYEVVDGVREQLRRHRRAIYGCFDYYAILYSETETVEGEPDVFNVSFNAFMSFVSKCKLVSKTNPPGMFEAIFSVVNAVDASQSAIIKEMDVHNSSRSLNRQEFLQCIVRCAHQVHAPADSRKVDMVTAVGALIEKSMLPNLPPEALQDSRVFRKMHCYERKTSCIIDRASDSLTHMYERYAEVSQGIADSLRDDSLMSIGEWLTFVSHMGLVDSGQLTLHSAKLIFAWSRIRSFGQGTSAAAIDRYERRLRHLSLIDFFEALIRMATMISFPTDEEIEAAGASDGGDFLIAMQRDSPKSFCHFIETHRPKHKHPDAQDWDRHADKPVSRCLQHLLMLLVKTVEFNTSAERDASLADGVVQSDEIRRFLKQRTKGAELKLKAELGEGVDFDEVIEIAGAKKIIWAAAIKIQMCRRLKVARRKVQERRDMVHISSTVAAESAPVAKEADEHRDVAPAQPTEQLMPRQRYRAPSLKPIH
jgi:hypothetical protein